MEVRWSEEAGLSYMQTIQYWDDRTKSNAYSNKIIQKVKEEVESIGKNPFFPAHYREKLICIKRFFSTENFHYSTR